MCSCGVVWVLLTLAEGLWRYCAAEVWTRWSSAVGGYIKQYKVCGTKQWGTFLQPLLQWERNNCYIFWVCFFRLSYSTYKARAPYCHLWPVRLFHIYPHYLINSTVFGKKLMVHNMCVLIVSTTFVRKLLNSKNEWARCNYKFAFVFMYKKGKSVPLQARGAQRVPGS